MAVTECPAVRGDASPALRLRLLGGFHLSRGEGDGGGQVDVPAGGQQLLALLGLRGPATRSVLAGTLESTRIDPLRESAHRAVVTVHLAENSLVEAVRHSKAFRGLLHAELGIEPSEQFRTMVRRGFHENG